MFVVLVEFTIHAEHFERFLDRVRQQARDSLRLETDCHVFDVCTDPARENFVLLYEVYSDRQAFDVHLASAHFAGFDRDVRDWVAGKVLTTLDRIEIED